MMKTRWSYWQIILLVVLFIASPLLFIIFAIIAAIYWYFIGKHNPPGMPVLKLEESDRPLLYIACGLTLVSLLIYQTGDYATQLGFPTTFITYYHQPGNGGISSDQLISWPPPLLINPLQGAINAAIYFLLLRLIRRLWRRHLVTA